MDMNINRGLCHQHGAALHLRHPAYLHHPQTTHLHHAAGAGESGAGAAETIVSTTSHPWFTATTQQQTQHQGYALPPLGRLLDPPPSNSREMRNRAEKMRRDKINKLISELGTLVPLVFNSPKRVDKTGVLRLSSTYLRIKHFQHSYKRFRDTMQSQSSLAVENSHSRTHSPAPTTTEDIPVDSMVQLVCDQLGGFLMVLSTQGKVVLVSHMVEALLGHNHTDLMGQSIYDLTHSEDHHRLQHQLSHDPNTVGDETGGEMRRNFNIRIARAHPRCEPVSFEPVSVSGVLVPSEFLICIVKVCRPPPLSERLMEASKDEYITRHLVDGRIINCDQRISVVAGYMSEEVAGLSAFTFMHREDVRWTMIALRQMYDRGESRGSSCYRLLSRTGQFIYLRTCGYLEVDSNGTVESFVCVNTLVSESEGQQLIQDMKARYSALIQPADPLSLTSSDSAASVEDPQQLEVAIQYLMHKLPGSPGSPAKEIQDCNSSDSSPPAAKRMRTLSPHVSPAQPDIMGIASKPHSYRGSAHARAAIALDRQMHKQQQITMKQCQLEAQNVVIKMEEQSRNIERMPLDRPL